MLCNFDFYSLSVKNEEKNFFVLDPFVQSFLIFL